MTLVQSRTVSTDAEIGKEKPPSVVPIHSVTVTLSGLSHNCAQSSTPYVLPLSMLVITALVGTRDLGQEVYIALTKADPGRGLVAGLCVAFIAIIADRLIQAGAQRSRVRLGLTEGRTYDDS